MAVDSDEAAKGSSLDAVERCLENAERFRHLNAFIRPNLHARDEASAVDQRHADGEHLPLRGMVIAVKDNIETAGLATSGGSVALQSYVPHSDAFALQALKRQGAVVIGKTNLDELAGGGSTLSSLGGQSRNPYDPARTPAGSSGGSAIAVATGACTFALGTETVNSIRNPANVCGILGLRPTRGLVSRSGVIPVSPTMDVLGPLASTVDDLARALRFIVGFDPADAVTLAAKDYDVDNLHPCRWPDVKGMRIGVLSGLFGQGEEHLGVNAVLKSALERLEGQGAEIIELSDPHFDSAALYADLALHAYEFHQAFDSWLEGLGDKAPISSFKAYVDDGRWPQATMQQLLAVALDAERPESQVIYARKKAAAQAIQQVLENLIDDHGLQAFAYPAQHRAALNIGQASRPERNGVLASAIGWPAINVPVGLSDGLPVGLDLMARPFQEPLLLSLAKAAHLQPPAPVAMTFS
ncbi:amidase [Allorhizobium taibaishanense]|uniref:Asp-tRNA(Asn)/Glu-tRNA(Gln) amidotransferase A subunit family amidase n=1 Tax=Allorhizobium taibaishanense TaxID=887144 RepID=A0A1Q9A302_9HYPH|nr:amidase [Allorhizobium taibaishanense]MBB4005941.1 Asp-tRNA(Asn)/Glu-tRNA(Gln) amidotransferase A subunit family amidase [Allorhizobium taibaishanense]OLP48970.1 hypothetical protein BJF91_17780 [Allorhizobium taibaishanense]